MAVVFPLESDAFDKIGILCSRHEPISDETMKEILDILESRKGDRFPGSKDLVFLVVLDDGARNAAKEKDKEERNMQWQKRSGMEEGISEDLVYDDAVKKKKKALICEIQQILVDTDFIFFEMAPLML
jgi:hypothetical protein